MNCPKYLGPDTPEIKSQRRGQSDMSKAVVSDKGFSNEARDL